LQNSNFQEKTMQYDTDRAIAVLANALAVCRGTLYSARTGDASQGEIERKLESTAQESLVALMGQNTYSHVMRLAEALSQKDIDTLLSIGDKPY
jgi:glycerol dehydrogenase-like iron-containing ADH family enzyme